MRRWRRFSIGAVAGLLVAGPLAVAVPPAAGQTAEPLEPVAVTSTIDLASMVDVDGFEARARAWSAAQADHRDAALARAEALAASTKAAEDAEQAEQERVEAEEAARRAAEEADEARQAAEAAAATTTTTVADPGVADSDSEAEVPPSSSDPDEGGGDEGGGSEADPAPPATGPTPEQWHALRDCESSNNYRAVSPDGRYRGAYQFSVPTWDWLAGTRYPELVGVDPIDAAPADQDRMALALYDFYGASPWPVCGSLLL